MQYTRYILQCSSAAATLSRSKVHIKKGKRHFTGHACTSQIDILEAMTTITPQPPDIPNLKAHETQTPSSSHRALRPQRAFLFRAPRPTIPGRILYICLYFMSRRIIFLTNMDASPVFSMPCKLYEIVDDREHAYFFQFRAYKKLSSKEKVPETRSFTALARSSKTSTTGAPSIFEE